MTKLSFSSRFFGAALAGLLPLFAAAALALDVPLTVTNREDTAYAAAAITAGVPFAQGALADAASLRLFRDGSETPAQFLTTALWPDNSVRWVLMDFQTDIGPHQTLSVLLQNTPPQAFSGITVAADGASFSVNTGSAAFEIPRSSLSFFGNHLTVDWNGHSYRAIPDAASWFVEESGPMKTVLTGEGGFFNGAARLRDGLIRFRVRLIFYRNKSEVRMFFTFRNNNSFGFDPDRANRKPDLVVNRVRFGVDLLPSGSYVFGSGVEKTFEVLLKDGTAALIDSRYEADGTIAGGFAPPPLLALAAPSYYASTEAWGRIVPVSTISDPLLRADVGLFEKLQRAKVIPADVEDPPGLHGITVWGHMFRDIGNWNHYGGLRWGGDFGPVSDNHYDWVYGMYLQMMRSGRLEFADAARVFAAHELDFAIYHTTNDGPAFNLQKNWESRPSDDGPGNDFGGGRPSHTWAQGYALHWLLTGSLRGKDGFYEIMEGIRQYVYESFNGEGYIGTRELRVPGWLVENLVTYWRIDPHAVFQTSSYGAKTIPQALHDVLQAPLDYEAADGGGGYVYAESAAEPYLRQPLMNCYFLEPAIKAYAEVFAGRAPEEASRIFGLIVRMTDWLMDQTFGGNSNSQGLYRPMQIPYMVDTRRARQEDGQVPYLLMAANAAGFVYLHTGSTRYLEWATQAFQDYIRYLGVTPGGYCNPSERTKTAYNSSVYPDTESKIHGWSNRYGQFFLSALGGAPIAPDYEVPVVRITSPRAGARVRSTFTLAGTAVDNAGIARVEYQLRSRGAWKQIRRAAAWRTRVRARQSGRLKVRVRARDYSGNLSPVAERRLPVRR